MNWQAHTLCCTLFILGLVCVSSQDIFELHHMQHTKIGSQPMGRLKEIPENFEVRGNEAKDIIKYIRDIHHIADNKDLTVLYKISVDTDKPRNDIYDYKRPKIKPKKYKVPLKKKYLKLSKFERNLRRLAEPETVEETTVAEYGNTETTVESDETFIFKTAGTTKMPHLKFKPIISRVNLLHHTQRLQIANGSDFHLKEIPQAFEVYGSSAGEDFAKLVNDIHNLARNDKLKIIYRVQVDTGIPKKKYAKNKQKKYNIPLKKSSMKLSNFEILMRKWADNPGLQTLYPEMAKINKQPMLKLEPTKIPVLKYKPVITKVHLNNYRKRIRPVKNRILTISNN